MVRRPASEEDEAPVERREREASSERTSGPPAEAEAPLVAGEGVNEGVDEMLEEAPEADGEDARSPGRTQSQD
jgi:hypothetical protein